MNEQTDPQDFSGARAKQIHERILYPLALLLAVMATRPFVGIEHDGFLYTAQALNRLDTVDLSGDLFFKYGNQDQFSPFTRLFAPAIAALGLQSATILFLVLGLLLWVIAAVVFAKALFKQDRLAWVGVFCALIVNARYGSLQLAYGENFVSPRLFAEGFVFLGLAQVLNRKIFWVLLCLILAGLAHPLIGLTGWIVGAWLWLGDGRKFGLLTLAGIALCLGLGAAGISPFFWIYERIDPEWMDLLRQRVAIVLVVKWNWLAAGVVMLPLASFAIIGANLARADVRETLLQIAIVVGLCVLASLVMTDLLGNRLFAALQMWRALFLLHFVAALLAAAAILLSQDLPHTRRLIIFSLAMNMIETQFSALPVASAVIALCALLGFWTERRASLKAPIRAVLWIIAGLVVLQFLAVKATVSEHGQIAELIEILLRTGALLLVLRWMLSKRSTGDKRASIVGLVVGVVALALLIDDRVPWKKFAESDDTLPAEILADLAGQGIYWEDGYSILWFKAHMPSYYSCRQKGGGVFFRDQLIEFERRAAGLRGLNTSDFTTDSECPVRADVTADGPTDVDQLRQACATLPDLDVLVLRAAFPDAARHVLTIPARFPTEDGGRSKMGAPNQTQMYFYFCEDLT